MCSYLCLFLLLLPFSRRVQFIRHWSRCSSSHSTLASITGLAAESWRQIAPLPSMVHGHIKSPDLPRLFLLLLLRTITYLLLSSADLPPGILPLKLWYSGCHATDLSNQSGLSTSRAQTLLCLGAFLVSVHAAKSWNTSTTTHLPYLLRKLSVRLPSNIDQLQRKNPEHQTI